MKEQRNHRRKGRLICLALSLALVAEGLLMPQGMRSVRAAEAEVAVEENAEQTEEISSAAGGLSPEEAGEEAGTLIGETGAEAAEEVFDAMILPEDEPMEAEEDPLPAYIGYDEDNPETLTPEEMQELKEEGTWEESLAFMQQLAEEQQQAQDQLIGNLAMYGPEGSEEPRQVSPEASYTEGVRQSITGVTPNMPAKGKIGALVFLVEFKDMTFPEKFKKGVSQIFFGKENTKSNFYPYESLSAFYKRSSYGNLNITGNVVRYRSKHPRSYYNNAKKDNSMLYREIFEAFKAQLVNKNKGMSADKALAKELKKYDGNGDHLLDGVYVLYAGQNGKWGSQWWSYRQGGATYDFGGGYNMKGLVFMHPKNNSLWRCVKTAIHETGHSLGLADLYSYDQTGVNKIRTYDMMDNNSGDHNAFNKMLLGWLPKNKVEVVTSDKTCTLSPYTGGKNGDVKLIMPVAEWAKNGIYSQFILAEYFKKVGNDSMPNIKANPGLRLYRVFARLNAKKNSFRASNIRDAYIPLISCMDKDFDEHKVDKNGYRNYDSLENCFYANGDEFAPWTVPGSSFYAPPAPGKAAANKASTLEYTGIQINGISGAGTNKLSFSVRFAEASADHALKAVGRYTTAKKNAKSLYVRLRFNQEVNVADDAKVQLYDADSGKSLYILPRAMISSIFPGGAYIYNRNLVYISLTSKLVGEKRLKVVIPAGALVTPEGNSNTGAISVIYDGTASENSSERESGDAPAGNVDAENAPIEKEEGAYSFDVTLDEKENGALVMCAETEDGEKSYTFYPVSEGEPDPEKAVSLAPIPEKFDDYYPEEAEIAQLEKNPSGEGYLLTIGGLYKKEAADEGTPTGEETDTGWITIDSWDEEGDETSDNQTENTVEAAAEAGNNELDTVENADTDQSGTSEGTASESEEEVEIEPVSFALLSLSASGVVESARFVEAGTEFSSGIADGQFCLITPETADTQKLSLYAFASDADPETKEIKGVLTGKAAETSETDGETEEEAGWGAITNQSCSPTIKKEGAYLAVSPDGYSWVLLNESLTAKDDLTDGESAGIFKRGDFWYVLADGTTGEEAKTESAEEEAEEYSLLIRFPGNAPFADEAAGISADGILALETHADSIAFAKDGTLLVYEQDGLGFLYDSTVFTEDFDEVYDIVPCDDLYIHAAFPGVAEDEVLAVCDSDIYSAEDPEEHGEEEEDGEETDPGELFIERLSVWETEDFTESVKPQILTPETWQAACWDDVEIPLQCDVDIPVIWTLVTGLPEDAGEYSFLEPDEETGDTLVGMFEEPGEYTVKVRAANEAAPTLYTDKEIRIQVKAEADYVSVSGIPAQVEYTGAAITFPEASLVYYGTRLKAGQDYTVSYKNNKDAGKAKDDAGPVAIFKLKGSYSGEVKVPFTILRADISGEEFHAADLTLTKKSSPQKLNPVLTRNGKKLTLNKDYTISESTGGTAVGTTPLTLTGSGNYTGSITINVKVQEGKAAAAKNLSAALKSLKLPNRTYTGSALTPVTERLLSDSGISLSENTDYLLTWQNNVNAGTGTALFTGIGDYTGSVKKTFKIAKYELAAGDEAVEVTLPETIIYEKSGMKPEPEVTVTMPDGEVLTLTAGKDYTLSYQNNQTITAGKTPTVIIKGKGNFSGQLSRPFKAQKQDISELTPFLEDALWKSGLKAQTIINKTPSVTDFDGKKLSAGKDYELKGFTYAADTTLADAAKTERKAGEAVQKSDLLPAGTTLQYTLAAKGSCYEGILTGEVRIVKSSIAKLQFSLNAIPVYSGEIPEIAEADIKAPEVELEGKKATVPFEVESVTLDPKTLKLSVVLCGTGEYGQHKTISAKLKAREISTFNQL